MALFIPGGPAGGSPSGSLGSIVFSHNRFGSYMRARVVPTNPGSAAQVLARNRMSDLTNRWLNTLTAAQRDAWTTYAANVPVTNRIGEQIYLTGLNWYVACNSFRDSEPTLSRVDDGPTIFNLSAFTVLAPPTASEATQQVSVTFPNTDDWADDDGAMLMFGTRPQNPSVNYNNLSYRYGASVLGDTAIPPTSPATLAYPFTFVAGQRIFVRFNVSQADGRIGAEQKYSIIAIA